MRLLNRYSLVLLSLLSLVAVAQANPNPAANVVDVQLNDNVTVVEDCQTELCLTGFDGDRLVFDANEASRDLRPGDVLVSDVTALAPSGFLKMITELQTLDGKTRVVTRDATLNELYAHGRIRVSTANAGAMGVTPRAGLTLQNAKSPSTETQQTFNTTSTTGLDSWVPTMGEILPDSEGYYKLVFSGSVNGFFTTLVLKVKPEFELVWEKEPNAIRPKYFKTVMYLDVKDVELTGVVGFASNVTLATLELPPLTLNVGVPLVMKNSLKLEATGVLTAGETVTGGMVIDQGSATLGSHYIRNLGWENLTHFDMSPEFKRPEITTPTLAATLLFPKVTFESSPYGIDNFQFFTSLSPINSIAYDTGTDQLSISGVTRASIGVKANFLGIDQEVSYNHEFLPYDLYDGSVNGLDWVSQPTETPIDRPSDSFYDIQNHWAYNELAFFIDQGYFSGYPDGTFRPDNAITRAEYMAMLAAVIDPAPKSHCSNRDFSDIDGHWAHDTILKMARACWTAGYPDGTFRPNNNITRLEIYLPLVSQPGLNEYDIGEMNDVLLDEFNIPSWAEVGIAKVFSNKIMVNHPYSNVFSPTLDAMRADVAAALYRLMIWRGHFANAHVSDYIADQ